MKVIQPAFPDYGAYRDSCSTIEQRLLKITDVFFTRDIETEECLDIEE